MAVVIEGAPVHRLIGVSLNAAIDKIGAVDRLEPGGIHRPDLLSSVPGGKALNAVRAARHLGASADTVAVIAGHAGDWLAGELAARGIRGWFVRATGETRTCLSILDRSTGALTEFYEAGLHLDDGTWPKVEGALSDAIAADPSGVVVLLAGSLPPGAPPDAYGRLARLASRSDARAIVDIGGEALVAALPARPWLVKVNASEAAAAIGVSIPDRASVVAAARRLIDLGAGRALITMGTEGAILCGADGVWHVGPPPAIGPYSVGSGDALTGGLFASLARGTGLVDALRLAAAAAAANALAPGQGELDRATVEHFATDVSVTPG